MVCIQRLEIASIVGILLKIRSAGPILLLGEAGSTLIQKLFCKVK